MPVGGHEAGRRALSRRLAHLFALASVPLVLSPAVTRPWSPVDRPAMTGEANEHPIPGPIQPGFKGEAYPVPGHTEAGEDPNAVPVTLQNADGEVVGTDVVRAGQPRLVEALDDGSGRVAIEWGDGVTAFAARENFWAMPSFVELKDMTVTIDGKTSSLGDSGLVYYNAAVWLFDRRETAEYDGIGPRAQRFLACEVDTWSMGQQTYTADLVELGVHQRDRSLIDKGAAGVDWAVAVPIDDAGVHILHRECDGKTAPDYGATHHTTQWLESMGRAVYLLAASEYAGDFRRKIDSYIDRIEVIADRLVAPSNWQQWEDAIKDENGHDFTHRTFMMAAALGLASTLTDDKNDAAKWSEVAARIAQRGIENQTENGVNPERGGYDVQYQMYGVRLAETYYSTLSPDSGVKPELEESIDRAIEWMTGRIDKRTGQINIGDSTRICAETNWWSGKKAEVLYAAETIRAFLLWGQVQSDTGLIDDAILLDRGEKQFGNECPAESASSSGSARGGSAADARGNDRSFETPIGRLSNRRVLAAAGAGLISFLLLGWLPLARRSTARNLTVRVGGLVVVFVAAVLVLAA
jgi:hypothetical protein